VLLDNEFVDFTSLFDTLKGIEKEFSSDIKNKIGVILAGSAGGGIQSAAKLLAEVGIMSGLYVSMKGEYPVTVGTGFSVAEVIISRNPINYTGLENPDVMIIISEDGLKKVESRINKRTQLFIDKKLDVHFGNVTKGPFIKNAGKKGAALHALSFWVNNSEFLKHEALLKAVKNHKYAEILVKAMQFLN
jgi:Pyruvate/2-oxoacid:ferredoxin oxidoreductase gamma subunit